MNRNAITEALRSPQQLQPQLAAALSSALSPHMMGSLTVLAEGDDDTTLPDSTLKFLIHSPQGQPAGVVLCSPPIHPSLVAQGAQRARLAQAAVAENLKPVVLTPCHEGTLGDCVRVYWDSERKLDIQRIFGVTTLELG